MFKVGQKVVCVDDGGGKHLGFVRHPCQSLRRGETYTIRATRTLPCCGDNIVDVGIDVTAIFILCHCGGTHMSHNRWWLGAYRFRPIDDLTAELAQTELSPLVEEKPEHLNEPRHVQL